MEIYLFAPVVAAGAVPQVVAPDAGAVAGFAHGALMLPNGNLILVL
jgi:hypothetical protein